METIFDMANINYPYGVLHDQKLAQPFLKIAKKFLQNPTLS